MQNGSESADDRHALYAERGAKRKVGGYCQREDAGVQKCRRPHAFGGVEAAHKHCLQTEAERYRQVPAQNFADGFGRFAAECAAFKKDSHGREAEGIYGNYRRYQDAEHAAQALPYFLVERCNLAFLNEARHVWVACHAYREAKDRDQGVHYAVGVVKARNAAGAKVCAKAADDEFEAEHRTYAKRHGEHHLEIANDVWVGRLDNQFVVDAAALCTKNLQGKKADERADRNAPCKTFETVVYAASFAEPNAGGAADNDCRVVDEACERRNQELLACVLHCHQDAAHEDEHLAWQDDAAVVCCAFQKFRGCAARGEQGQKLRHEDECGHYQNQQQHAECV